MKGQWNTDFYDPLKAMQQTGDIFIYKNRLSGFWGGAGVEAALEKRGIKTLLFSGCNLDHPDYARKCIEFNTAEGWGFVLACKDFEEGVQRMLK
ncbi:hypothetical protein OQA88_9908 [Cercophora sp. LCS_1]